jgi:hypothetical protein
VLAIGDYDEMLAFHIRIGWHAHIALGGIFFLDLLFVAAISVLIFTDTFLISSGHTVTMTIAKVTLSDWYLAINAIAELDPGLATGGEGTDQFISVFNSIRDDKVGSLEVVIDRHTTSTAGDYDCTSGPSEFLLKIHLVVLTKS